MTIYAVPSLSDSLQSRWYWFAYCRYIGGDNAVYPRSKSMKNEEDGKQTALQMILATMGVQCA